VSKTLTKAKIVETIAEQNGFTKTEAKNRVEAMLEIMKRTLESGEDVLISGFGKFRIRDKNKRRGWNPATGNDMILDARRVVTFKCSTKLREMINR
jgi:integration host factor subunit alpha